ncbi:MAG: hypothetical protein R3321_13430 [Nitrososphaeraceae archaeon]|nr:hypothetical protein [Nitrososphaeraceae archaeon]
MNHRIIDLLDNFTEYILVHNNEIIDLGYAIICPDYAWDWINFTPEEFINHNFSVNKDRPVLVTKTKEGYSIRPCYVTLDSYSAEFIKHWLRSSRQYSFHEVQSFRINLYKND